MTRSLLSSRQVGNAIQNAARRARGPYHRLTLGGLAWCLRRWCSRGVVTIVDGPPTYADVELLRALGVTCPRCLRAATNRTRARARRPLYLRPA